MKNHADEKPAARDKPRGAANVKEEKLAQALRRNLMRRKVSDRGRKPTETQEAP